MTITVTKGPEETTIAVTGRLDTISAPELDRTIQEDNKDAQNIILDLAGLEYISSAGLRVLLGAQKKLQQTGTMKLRNICQEVMDVFEMTGFSEILVIEN